MADENKWEKIAGKTTYAEIRVFKHKETGEIITELYVGGNFENDYKGNPWKIPAGDGLE